MQLNNQHITKESRCTSKKQFTKVCFDCECSNFPFLCGQRKCPCQENHKNCEIGLLTSLRIQLKNKKKYINDIFIGMSNKLINLYKNMIQIFQKGCNQFQKWQKRMYLPQGLEDLHNFQNLANGSKINLHQFNLNDFSLIKKYLKTQYKKLTSQQQIRIEKLTKSIQEQGTELLKQIQSIYLKTKIQQKKKQMISDTMNKIIKGQIARQKQKNPDNPDKIMQNKQNIILELKKTISKKISVQKISIEVQTCPKKFTQTGIQSSNKQYKSTESQICIKQFTQTGIQTLFNKNNIYEPLSKILLKLLQINTFKSQWSAHFEQFFNDNIQTLHNRLGELTFIIKQSLISTFRNKSEKLKLFNLNDCSICQIKKQKNLLSQTAESHEQFRQKNYQQIKNRIKESIQNQNSKVQAFINQINSIKFNELQQIIQFFEARYNKFNQSYQTALATILEQASNITSKEKLFIQKLLGKNIKKFELLYKASENKFLIEPFWKACNQKSNIFIIVKNEFNQIFGGYSPLGWNSELSGRFSEDRTNQSFLFHCTRNMKKIQLVEPKKSIRHNINNGPIFGSGFDLFISNRADIEKKSFANIGNSYVSEQFTFQKMKNFTGNDSTPYFFIKEWQVYQLL